MCKLYIFPCSINGEILKKIRYHNYVRRRKFRKPMVCLTKRKQLKYNRDCWYHFTIYRVELSIWTKNGVKIPHKVAYVPFTWHTLISKALVLLRVLVQLQSYKSWFSGQRNYLDVSSMQLKGQFLKPCANFVKSNICMFFLLFNKSRLAWLVGWLFWGLASI